MTQDVYAHATMDSERLLKWYALDHLKGLGAKRWRAVLQYFSSDPLDFFNAAPAEWAACGFSTGTVRDALACAEKQFDHLLHWQKCCQQHHLLTFDHPAYSERLAQIARPPLFLFAKGALSALSRPCLAIVGARTPTLTGLNNAEFMAGQLTQNGWGIVSGLARGIDGAAHRATVAAGGVTIAVLGTGVDHIYPRSHISLANQIVDSGGLLLSEFPLGTPPKAHHFPRRNRIISGLCKGTLVVEAAIKSGSLLTAKEAMEQGRDVFAIPGNISSKMSEGCHWLIKQGAKLVTGIDDIIEDYQSVATKRVSFDEKYLQKKPGQCLARDQLLDSVDFEVTALDVVAKRSKMPLSDVLARLLEYELRGLVAAVPGGYIKLGEK